MTTRTLTDNRALEALFTDTPAFCHLFPPPEPVRSYCGIPRSEQSPHGPAEDGWWTTKYCPACGLPRCPTCTRKAAS